MTSYFENLDEGRQVEYILPVLTQPYDFKQHKRTVPLWEELLVFNENFNYIIHRKPNVVVFFEVRVMCVYSGNIFILCLGMTL